MKRATAFWAIGLLLILAAMLFLWGRSLDFHKTPPEYNHFTPLMDSHFRLEFDYPSDWWSRDTGEISAPTFYTLAFFSSNVPTPDPNNTRIEPIPNRFNQFSIDVEPLSAPDYARSNLYSYIWSRSNDQTAFTVLNDYWDRVDGIEARVVEYQFINKRIHPEPYFLKDIYFLHNDQIYMLSLSIPMSERGGEFEQGFEVLLASLKLVR